METGPGGFRIGIGGRRCVMGELMCGSARAGCVERVCGMPHMPQSRVPEVWIHDSIPQRDKPYRPTGMRMGGTSGRENAQKQTPDGRHHGQAVQADMHLSYESQPNGRAQGRGAERSTRNPDGLSLGCRAVQLRRVPTPCAADLLRFVRASGPDTQGGRVPHPRFCERACRRQKSVTKSRHRR